MRLNYAGSADLVAQLQQGAPVDVFASADTVNMDDAVAADLVSGQPTSFATNSMMIAVPPENPAKVASFATGTPRRQGGRSVAIPRITPHDLAAHASVDMSTHGPGAP